MLVHKLVDNQPSDTALTTTDKAISTNFVGGGHETVTLFCQSLLEPVGANDVDIRLQGKPDPAAEHLNIQIVSGSSPAAWFDTGVGDIHTTAVTGLALTPIIRIRMNAVVGSSNFVTVWVLEV